MEHEKELLTEITQLRTEVMKDVSAYDLDKMPLLEQELAMIIGIIKQLKLDSLAARNVASARLQDV